MITDRTSAKVGHVRAAGCAGARVAVCQVDGQRWATPEGRAFVRTDRDRDRDRERVGEAVRRYAERYGRTPSPNPHRVVIEIELTAALGRG